MLIESCKKGDIRKVKKMLSKKWYSQSVAQIDCKDFNGKNCLAREVQLLVIQ